MDYDDIFNALKNEDSIDVIRMMTNNFNRTLTQISSSNFIVSSSLHGLILAIAYDIPCIWVEFSNKIFGDDVKFYDFFESLNITNIQKHIVKDPLKITDLLTQQPITANRQMVDKLQRKLLEAYPFPIDNQIIKNYLN